MGDGLVKSAYYVIYISQQELDHTRTINENSYEPNKPNFEVMHPYGSITDQEILRKILDDNRKLVQLADEYKATELAKKVTTVYEKSFDEIQKVME